MKSLKEKLVSELKPVKVISSVRSQFFKWGIAALIFSSVFIFFFGQRIQSLTFFKNHEFLIEWLILLALLILSSLCVILASIPGRLKKFHIRVLSTLFIALLISFFLRINLKSLFIMDLHFDCAVHILLLSLAPSLFFIYKFRSLYCINRKWLAFFIFLSSGLTALFLITSHCIITTPMHIFLWHYLPVGILLMLSRVVYKYILKSL